MCSTGDTGGYSAYIVMANAVTAPGTQAGTAHTRYSNAPGRGNAGVQKQKTRGGVQLVPHVLRAWAHALHTHVYTQVYTHVYTHVYAHVYTQVYADVCTRDRTQNRCTCLRACPGTSPEACPHNILVMATY